uniref:Uncharacterized protein n=1 Tax=viral metagenome TaxID=1070528 RepID=A0A6H2A637_9ZZZZ
MNWCDACGRPVNDQLEMLCPECKARAAGIKLCGFCGQDDKADHNGCLQILSTRRK